MSVVVVKNLMRGNGCVLEIVIIYYYLGSTKLFTCKFFLNAIPQRFISQTVGNITSPLKATLYI
jgi:hypothetical protein